MDYESERAKFESFATCQKESVAVFVKMTVDLVDIDTFRFTPALTATNFEMRGRYSVGSYVFQHRMPKKTKAT